VASQHPGLGDRHARIRPAPCGVQKLHIVGATSVTTDGGSNWRFSSGSAPSYSRSPIAISISDDGLHWSAAREISGSSAACTTPVPDRCDHNQFSYPTIAPEGKVYVSFENFNTANENQLLVALGSDGNTWSLWTDQRNIVADPPSPTRNHGQHALGAVTP